jgi:hypothetical protein
MPKYLIAAALATLLWAPQAEGQSIARKSDWHGTKFAAFLSSPADETPSLDLEEKIRLPKGDFPSGGHADQSRPSLALADRIAATDRLIRLRPSVA